MRTRKKAEYALLMRSEEELMASLHVGPEGHECANGPGRNPFWGVPEG